MPEYFKPIMWSYDFNAIDPTKDKKTIIINAINYGDLKHWKWMIKFYGREAITEVLKRPRGRK